MTAENAQPEYRARRLIVHVAAAALFVAVLAASGGWVHTMRELNQLVAYRCVGAEALRMAQSARTEKAATPAIYAGKRE